MRSGQENQDHQPKPSVIRSEFSRRAFLQVSAVGLSSGLIGGSAGYVAGWSSRAGADISDWTTANIPPQQGRRVLVTGANGYPEGDGAVWAIRSRSP